MSQLKIQVKMYLGMFDKMPGVTELKNSLIIPADKSSLRWSADYLHSHI